MLTVDELLQQLETDFRTCQYTMYPDYTTMFAVQRFQGCALALLAMELYKLRLAVENKPAQPRRDSDV